jgi:outer membrane PBP1 activator LpoA protein
MDDVADVLEAEMAELMEKIMLGKWAKVVVLFAMLNGLCASAQPITTSPAGNDAAPKLVALLLPLRSNLIGTAADAVRNGFLAASERQRGNMIITVIETGDAVPEVLAAYRDAVAKYDIVVGPLSRSAVTALAQSASVTRPTVALTLPDLPDSAEQRLPSQMLLIGLSIEDEARQVADWVERDKTPGKIFTIATNVAWQHRAAKAFAIQARKIGLSVDELDLSVTSNLLSAGGLAQLSQRIQAEKPALLFVALDASQTSQLRSAVGNDIPIYGTSQLNPLSLAAATKMAAEAAAAAKNTAGSTDGNAPPALPVRTAVANLATVGGNSGSNNGNDKRRNDLDGVRLLDLPWQLHAAYPPVRAYPHAVGSDSRSSADLERLYALGIDAFRVVDELVLQHSSFDLDGVTGQINVNMTTAATYFQRRETQAVYQNGIVVPLSSQR